MKRILVLEDEEGIRSFIVVNLKRAGYKVFEAETGEDALKIINNNDIDISVLDVMLPGIDGYEVCKKIRENDKAMGIIMLTAKGQEMDKINGLGVGADDYVVKPFSPGELLARIEALARRVDLVKQSIVKNVSSGPFILDYDEHKIYKNSNPLDLTQLEFELMNLFLNNSNKALKRDTILDKVWGKDYFGSEKIVDVNVRRLRSKIEDDPSNPIFIETVWGYGYIWREDV